MLLWPWPQEYVANTDWRIDMSYVIAVAGKGGVGKTTLSSLLVRALSERSGEIILAVDADPNANLGEKLGVTVGKTIGDLREDLLKSADDIPAGTSKHEYVRYQMQLATVEGQKFDLLTMGRPEGPGCYCYINNILRTYLDGLMDEYPYVVIDNEAGMEHLSRRTTRKMNLLLVVSDATKLGVETAARIRGLADEMEIEIGSKVLIINRAPREVHPAVKEAVSRSGFEEIIHLPNDSKVEELTVAGEPLTRLDPTSTVYRVVAKLVKDLK